MSSRSDLRLEPNAAWPGIVERILGSDPKAAAAARTILWLQVSELIERRVRLPMGPLNEDDDVRREIADKLLAKLEANSYYHLREWRNRTVNQRSNASWWTWIKRMADRLGIDAARACLKNVAGRNEPRFRWVKVEPVDPFVLAEIIGGEVRGPLPFLDRCSAEEMTDLMMELQESRQVGDAPAADGPGAARPDDLGEGTPPLTQASDDDDDDLAEPPRGQKDR